MPDQPFDVFISSNPHDAAWVRAELLPRLERHGLQSNGCWPRKTHLEHDAEASDDLCLHGALTRQSDTRLCPRPDTAISASQA